MKKQPFKLRTILNKDYGWEYQINVTDFFEMLRQYNPETEHKEIIDRELKTMKREGSKIWDFLKTGYGSIPDSHYFKGDVYILGVYLSNEFINYYGSIDPQLFRNLYNLLSLSSSECDQWFIDTHIVNALSLSRQEKIESLNL